MTAQAGDNLSGSNAGIGENTTPGISHFCKLVPLIP